MQSKQTILDVMRLRKSVRTYLDTPLRDEHRQMMKEEADQHKTPTRRFEIIEAHFEDGSKIGTYGWIKGAKTYLIGIMDKDYAGKHEAAASFGYAFEQVVLLATALGLGTCWMVSTFDKKSVAAQLNLAENENIVMVSPLGYEAVTRPLEKAIKFLSQSGKRKPKDKLFFMSDGITPLSLDSTDPYHDVLEMVQIAPSAANTQPWRIIQGDGGYHFYTVKDMPEINDGKINVTYNDMGIAMCHFEMACTYHDLKGKWTTKDQKNPNGWHYVTSWTKLT